MKITLPLAAALMSAAFLAPAAVQAADGRAGFFTEADANKDGTVTKDELAAYQKAEIAGMDANNDGFVTADEMKAFILAKMADRAAAMADKRIGADDKDGDGKLSLAELQNDDRMQRMFARLDANGDGTLTKDELDKARGRWMRHRAGGPMEGKGDGGDCH